MDFHGNFNLKYNPAISFSMRSEIFRPYFKIGVAVKSIFKVLYSIDTENYVTTIPHKRDYDRWRMGISDKEYKDFL